MNLHDIENEPFGINGIQILPIRAMHYKLPVLGFRFGSFGYLTDLKTIEPDELKKLEGVNVLVIEALRKEEHISHLNLSEALQIIEKINPRKAYLTHISHLMGLQAEVGNELPKNVSFAYDGLCIDL